MAQSAKALFRATKAKPVPIGPGMFGDRPAQPAPERKRRSDDYYPTGKPEAIRVCWPATASGSASAARSGSRPVAMAPWCGRSAPRAFPAALRI